MRDRGAALQQNVDSALRLVEEHRGESKADVLATKSQWLKQLKSDYSLSRVLNHGRLQTSRWHWLIKRSFDFTFSALVLVLTLPLFITIGVAIKLNSRGPVFFVQERVGERLRLFNIFKFRTMYEDSGAMPVTIYDEKTQEFRRPFFYEDPRVTWVGRLLRKWSLDELPQFINILIGDMSLVGPRPLMSHEALAIPAEAMVRYSVPAGLTGFAQIRDRNIVHEDRRFDDDVSYVNNLSFREDLRIVLATPAKIKQE